MTPQVIRRRSPDPLPCAEGGANDNNCCTAKTNLLKVVLQGWNSCERCPGSVELWASFIIRAINKRARRQMARLLFAWAVLSETRAKWIPVWKRESLPNVSRSAKLECRHKIEVTLIDYLELICIFRVIMGVGNRTNRHSRLCRALMMFLITLSSPPAAGKISKGLSSRIWTINEQTWSRGAIWKWARSRPLSERLVSCYQHAAESSLWSRCRISDVLTQDAAWEITLLNTAACIFPSVWFTSLLTHFLLAFRSIQGERSYFQSISRSTWSRCSIKTTFLDIPKNIIVLCWFCSKLRTYLSLGKSESECIKCSLTCRNPTSISGSQQPTWVKEAHI